MSVLVKEDNIRTTKYITFNSAAVAKQAAFQQACVQMRYHIIGAADYTGWLTTTDGMDFLVALHSYDLEAVNIMAELLGLHHDEYYYTYTVEGNKCSVLCV